MSERRPPTRQEEHRLDARARALLQGLSRLEASPALERRIDRALRQEALRRGVSDPAAEAAGRAMLRRAPRLTPSPALWARIAVAIRPVAARRALALCRRFDRLVDDLLDGALPPGLGRALEHHAGQCAACAATLARARAARALLRDAGRVASLPARTLALREAMGAGRVRRVPVPVSVALGAAAVLAIVFLAGSRLRQVAVPEPSPAAAVERRVAIAPEAAPPAAGGPVAARDEAGPDTPPTVAAAAPRPPSRTARAARPRTPGPALRRTPPPAVRTPAAPDRIEPSEGGADRVLVVANRPAGQTGAPLAAPPGTADRTARIGRIDAETLTL